jgi:two-component system chemotaxis response regulator CheY
MALNVLIVDDSAVMRAMILKTMRMAGLPLGEVYQAANGQEGLEALDAHWIDLVIADINMPVMNGEEMIQSLRQNPDTAQTPVVVVSTEGSQTRIERLNRMGVKFVHKPFTPEIIRDTVMGITELEDSDVDPDSDDSGADSF